MRRTVLVAAACLGLALASPTRSANADAPLVIEGDGVSVEIATDPFELTVYDGAGNVAVSDAPGGGYFYAEGMHLGGPISALEVSIPFDVDFVRHRLTRVLDHTEIEGGYDLEVATSERSARTADVRVTATGPRRVHVEIALSSTYGVYRHGARLEAAPGEDFTGLGERFDGVAHRGKDLPLGGSRWYGGSDFLGGVHLPEQDHAPIPFLVSSRGWAVALWNDGNGVRFDVAKRRSNAVEAAALTSSGPIVYDLYVGGNGPDRIKTLLGDYTADVGRPGVLPTWAYGVWRSKDRWATQEIAADDHAMWRDQGLPLDGFVLDSPWETTYNTWEFNPEQFADIGGFLDDLNADGVHPLVWMTGWMNYDSTDGDRVDSPQSDDWAKNPAEPYAPMTDAGLFVRRPDGEPNNVKWWMGKGSTIDFTNPAARSYWIDLATDAIEEGIAGIKIDGMEGFYVSDASTFASGRTGADGAWSYIPFYRDVTADLLESVRGDDWVSFGRAGWHGVQGQSMTWAGDQWSSPAGLREVMSSGLTAGVTGISNWFADVGGYNGRPPSGADVLKRILSGFDFGGNIINLFAGFRPSGELIARWSQVGALSPTFQHHSKADSAPWYYDSDIQDIYRDYALMHEELVPYIRAMAAEAERTGVPILRMLAIEEPDAGDAWHTDDAYLFGDSFFVAPVVDLGRRARTVRLPEGRWVDYWTGEAADGGVEIAVDAPIWKLPLWVRAGAIVPTFPKGVTSVTGSDDPEVEAPDGRLDVRVWPGDPPGSVKMADGTEFGADTSSLRWNGTPADSLLVAMPAASAPAVVTAGGVAIDAGAGLEAVQTDRVGWFFDAETETVWVGAPGDAGDVTLAS